MNTFFYSNISEFSEKNQGMLNEVTYKTTIQNMRKLGWKAQFSKQAGVSILVHGCGVSQYPQFYEKLKINIKRVANF